MNQVSQKRSIEQVTRELITLQKISNALISTSYLDDVLKIVVEGLEKGLTYEAGILFILDASQNTLYPHITHRNQFIRYLEEHLGVGFSSVSIPLDQSQNLLASTVEQKKILTTEILNEVLYGISANVPPDIGEEMLNQMGVQLFVGVPMIVREEVAGVILCATSRDVITQPEMESLRNFANQAGLAVDNAQIMNSLKRTQSELAVQNDRLNKTYNELRELERLKNGLTGMVVHDMKNPLTAVRGYLELILETNEHLADESALIDYIKKAYESSEDLLKMIHNLLDVSRMEEGKFTLNRTQCLLQDVMNSVYEQLGIVAKNNKRNLKLQKLPDVPIVNIDYDIIHRVIANLVSNAIKHTPKEGEILMSMQINAEDEILVCVKDNGDGIPKDHLETIFQKFSQVKGKDWKNTHNVGLGLTFCKMAINTHGGEIWVDSELDKGSKFYFTLPRVA